MKRSSIVPGISRRDFVKNPAAVAAFAATGLGTLDGDGKPERRKMIGVQVGAASFLDENCGNGPAKQAKAARRR